MFICRLHINILYRPAMRRFWCSASLNVSAVPPLHSGFFCVTSPGLNYVFMGQVDEEGRGKIAPHHFVMAFKTKNQKGLSVLKNKRCWVTVALRISAGRCSWGRPSCTVDGNNQANKMWSPSQQHKYRLKIQGQSGCRDMLAQIYIHSVRDNLEFCIYLFCCRVNVFGERGRQTSDTSTLFCSLRRIFLTV